MKLSALTGNKHVSQNGTTECGICLSEMTKEDELVQRACQHVFHEACDKPWRESAIGKLQGCSICRSKQVVLMNNEMRDNEGVSREEMNRIEYDTGYYIGLFFLAVCFSPKVLALKMTKDCVILTGYVALTAIPGIILGGKIAGIMKRIRPPEGRLNGCFYAALLDVTTRGWFGMASSMAALSSPIFNSESFGVLSQ